MQALREERQRREKLEEEKGALLDYVEESVDKQEKAVEEMRSLEERVLYLERENRELSQNSIRVTRTNCSSREEEPTGHGSAPALAHENTFGAEELSLSLKRQEQESNSLRHKLALEREQKNIQHKTQQLEIDSLSQKLSLAERIAEETETRN